MTNQTGRPLRLWTRVVTPSFDLDARIRIATAVGDKTVVDAALVNARPWSGGLVIPAGGRRRVRVNVSLPPDARDTEYRAADLRLELRGDVVS